MNFKLGDQVITRDGNIGIIIQIYRDYQFPNNNHYLIKNIDITQIYHQSDIEHYIILP